MGVGLGEGGEPHGLLAGLRRGGERRREVVRREPVERELGGHAAGGDRQRRIGLQRARQRGVQRPALAGEQVVGQRLAHERVAEAVGVGLGVRHDDVVRHRLAQPGHELVGRQAGRALEQPVAHARPGDGSEAQDGLGGRAQRLDAQHERIGDVGRQALAGGGSGQLLGEERVALGAGEELVHQARLGPAPEDPGELRDDLLAREALQCRRARRSGRARLRPPAPAGDGGGAARRCGMWRRAARAGGARCARRRPGSRARSGRPSGRPRRRARAAAPGPAVPGGRAGARTRDPARARARVAGLRRVELGQQRRETRCAVPELAGVEAAQRADDRRVRQLAVAQVDAVAGQHARALRPRAGGELGDQARLADARLARDERDRRAPIGRASSAADRPASSRSRPTNSGLVTLCVS